MNRCAGSGVDSIVCGQMSRERRNCAVNFILNLKIMTYEELIGSAPVVVVEFYATWCGHCRAMQPVVDDIKELLGDSVPLYQLDVDENRDTANDERVNGTPTFIVYKNGKEMWRWSGEIEGNTLLAKIQHFV